MPTDQFNRLLRTLSTRQRWTIAVAVVLLAAGIYGFAAWERESGFRPLYNGMSPEDAALVLQKLKETGVPYRLSNNGGSVLVPEERVAELRLEMAGAGLPKNGRIGFELFDKANFGITEFAEHVNYRRALEGELERSVMSVAEIEQARVHISLPQESVFLEARQPAKASVLIKIRQGASLPETAIPAITNLVASAVEGLGPENVSVLDMRGNLLNRPKKMGGSTDDSSVSTLEYRHKVEQDLAAKLDSTLEPVVGAGRFRTAVSADCDITSGEQSEETFDPTKSVMVSSQKTEDTSTTSHTPSGVPGTASNLPDSTPKAATGGTTSRKTENINYQTSRTVKRTVLPQGGIRRLSISVLIDQDVHWEANGTKRVLVPPTEERLKSIRDLVSAAAGLNTTRGDQLIVESLPFEQTLNLDPPPTQPAPVTETTKKLTPQEQLKNNPKLMIGLAGMLVLVLGGGAFAVFKMTKSKKNAVDVRVAEALPNPAAACALDRAGASHSELSPHSSVPTLGPARVEVLTTQLRATAQKNGEVCAGVLRGWLSEERA
jgi:flagellar M-ring protein FliF